MLYILLLSLAERKVVSDMARYIDADKTMEEIYRIGGHNLCEWDTIGVKALIDRQPTADVAPKSEVAREIFEEIEDIIKSPHTVGFNLTAPLKEALGEYNEGIRKERLYYINKLKEKYTEGEG